MLAGGITKVGSQVECWPSSAKPVTSPPASLFQDPAVTVTRFAISANPTIGACALLSNHSVACWGTFTSGPTGDDTVQLVITPMTFNLRQLSVLGLDPFRVVILSESGVLFEWQITLQQDREVLTAPVIPTAGWASATDFSGGGGGGSVPEYFSFSSLVSTSVVGFTGVARVKQLFSQYIFGPSVTTEPLVPMLRAFPQAGFLCMLSIYSKPYCRVRGPWTQPAEWLGPVTYRTLVAVQALTSDSSACVCGMLFIGDELCSQSLSDVSIHLMTQRCLH